MRIAVLMSTYNGEEYIKEQIDSILAQKGDFELDLWVRDDGSKDNTQKILQDYAEKKYINWYTGDNLKPAHSFIDLLKHCEDYDYYAFADQDDYWMPDKIEAGIAMLKEYHKPALYCANANLVDSKLNYLGRNVYKSTPKMDFYTLICAGGLLGCTMIFNSALAKLIQSKETPSNMVLHDFYVAAVCVSLGGEIIFDDKPYMKYRQHESNVVGVPHGIKGTISARLNDIKKKKAIGIAEQSESIMVIYQDLLEENKKKWLCKVSKYKQSIINRIVMACSMKTKYMNKNMSLKLRLSILLGNR